MQISYEIDELMDRINSKKTALEKESPSFFVTDEDFNKNTMKRDLSKGRLAKNSSSTMMQKGSGLLDNAFPLLDLQKVQQLP
jgi:hypothetical protein